MDSQYGMAFILMIIVYKGWLNLSELYREKVCMEKSYFPAHTEKLLRRLLCSPQKMNITAWQSRQSGDKPLMYSRFCYYNRQDEQKRRATMHINRKPGEQIEVDWAGDPARLLIRIPAGSSLPASGRRKISQMLRAL